MLAFLSFLFFNSCGVRPVCVCVLRIQIGNNHFDTLAAESHSLFLFFFFYSFFFCFWFTAVDSFNETQHTHTPHTKHFCVTHKNVNIFSFCVCLFGCDFTRNFKLLFLFLSCGFAFVFCLFNFHIGHSANHFHLHFGAKLTACKVNETRRSAISDQLRITFCFCCLKTH